MKILKVIGLVVVLAAVGAGVVLVRQSQETRRGAYFGKVGVSLWPDSGNIEVGKELTVKMKMTADENRVSAVNFKLNLSSDAVEVVSVKVNESAFNTVSKAEVVGGQVWLVALSTKTSGELPTGAFDVATIVLRGKKDGMVNLNFGSDYEITGWNSAGGGDKQLEASFSGVTYKVGTGAGSGDGDFAKVDFYLSPESGTVEIGKGTKVEARLKTGTTKVSSVNLKIKYDKTKLKVTNLVKGDAFDSAPILTVDEINGVVNLSLLSMKASAQLPSGEVKLVEFELVGVAAGTGTLTLNSGYEIVGYNPSGGSNTIGLLKIGNGSYSVGGAAVTQPGSKYFAMVDSEFRPASGQVKVGEKLGAGVWLKTGTTKVSAVNLKIKYDKTKLKIANLVKGDAFDSAPILAVDENNGLINLSLLSMKASSQLPSGEVKLVGFDLLGVTAGSSEMSIDGIYEIVGYNAGTGGNLVGLSDMGKGSYVVGEGSVGGDYELNFRVAFGKLIGDARCVTNWPLTVTMLGKSGVSRVYTGVVAVKDGGGYKGSVVLTGFNERDGVAVFVKGPKHLQMKYGVNNQKEMYSRAGGEISLVNGAVYDFSGLPLMAGDVDKDGWVNGVDFSMVKQKSLTHETVAEGGYILEDLDGNCQVNSNDVTVLKLSLNEKQESLY